MEVKAALTKRTWKGREFSRVMRGSAAISKLLAHLKLDAALARKETAATGVAHGPLFSARLPVHRSNPTYASLRIGDDGFLIRDCHEE